VNSSCWKARARRSAGSQLLVCLAALLVIASLLMTTTLAGDQRARLSTRLAARLASGEPIETDLIVQGTRSEVDALAAAHGAHVARRMSAGAVLRVDRRSLLSLAEDPRVAALAEDEPVYSTMALTVETTGADQAWAGLPEVAGVTGRGVGVAVIDSGIADRHPALGRVRLHVDFTGGDARDWYGHGTHVAGIVGGNGPHFQGMAPDAHLVSLRVLGPDGVGRTSDVIEALDWVVAHKDALGLRVVNLSVGKPPTQSWRDDPLALAASRAVAAGLVVVCSVGNLGETRDGRRLLGAVTSPGNAPAVITVGAADAGGTVTRGDDRVATWSSRGPTYLDRLIKPDLVAPGRRVRSTAAKQSMLAQRFANRVSRDGQYLVMSGSSMAAAVVSGAAALLFEVNPRLTPAEVKVALQVTASFLPEDGLIAGGAGELAVPVALRAAAFGPRPVPSFWHLGGEAVTAGGLGFGDGASRADGSSGWGKTLVWGESLVWGEDTSGAKASSGVTV
jgi:serine protease AprX